jgi:hypothetical protein
MAAGPAVRTIPSELRSAREDDAVVQARYEVHAHGILPDWACAERSGLAVERRPVETVVHAPVSSPSALASLLTWLENRGLSVVSFRLLSPRARDGHRPGPRPR